MVVQTTADLLEKLGQLDILSPVDPEAVAKWRPAPRLSSLYGKTGGFLGNRKANAEVLLASVKELMNRQFELQDSLEIDKFIYSRPAADDVINTLADRCDFVVTAIAD
ncbi:MAG: hypothetical protein BZY88_07070 [SAR202 cluster bacterium Io17-Chloro-G9]|nr:MAG: hypothetical protein BZY88_07070 [SAR202 cluster bacterium Io17-Chloro-G9]